MRGSNRDIGGRDYGRVRGLGGEGVQHGDGGLWAVAGTTQPGGRGGRIRMAFTRWEAPRRRGDALLFSGRSSSTENSVVLTTLYAFNITLATCPPRQGYATVTSVCCLRLNQV